MTGTTRLDQLQRAAALAGHQGLPRSLQWATGKVGGGVLTFLPSAGVDLYNAVSTDRATGRTQFNGQQFLIDSARSQSGNLVGFAGGLGLGIGAVAFFSAAVAGWPVLIIGLAGGVLFQLAWNALGGADAASNLMRDALR